MPEPCPPKVFEALADPVRRTILQMVAQREHAAGTLAAGIGEFTTISQPAISQHLKVLREAGLVQVRPDGTRRIYTLDPAGVEIAQRWLTTLVDPLDVFSQPLDALATEIARGTRRRRGADPGSRGSSAGSRSA
ncbi:MAG: winged helix-turn-helix transcriptional regulator [Nocardia sp.]|nr:winged helix-turn-helix transcriptional regulator [Nocardia sp.]